MKSRRFPIGRFAVLAAVAFAILTVTKKTDQLRFKPLGPGVEFATIRGEPYCRHGSPDIAVLRLDPARVRVRVHHFTREPGRKPLKIVEWQRRTGALAVFNAGQYYPDYSYMGLFVSGGVVVSKRLHPSYRAALVASPRDGGRGARVLDLEHQPLDARSPGWREVAQSFMLFDRSGAIRTRRSNSVANRTVVAEDRNRRLLVFTSEGSYTLYDFADLLQSAQLQLTHAMSMDGGDEAELLVKTKSFHYASFAHWRARAPEPEDPAMQVPLPAVVSVTAP